MKTFHSTIVTVVFSMFLLSLTGSCSGDDASKPAYTCTVCSDTPQGLAIHDQSAAGLYKGIVVGSTGTLSINIQNGSNTITATLVLDGITSNLTTSTQIINGEPYTAPFTGTYNGLPVTVTFQVNADGGAPTVVSSDIPGHANAIFQVYKETSTSMIEAFEGTFTVGGESGTFNILLSTQLGGWKGVAKKNGGEVSYVSGTVNAAGMLYDDNDRNIGKINGDVLKGSFTDSNNEVVKIEGQRTL